MANSVYTGAGQIVDANDYRYVKWVGTTKGGKSVTIVMSSAFCRSNIDWTMLEKNDVVPELQFEGAYSDSNLASGTRTEPWTIEIEDGVLAGAAEIVLGAGVFYVGTQSSDAAAVALTRGGGSFTVEREYREINADGDPGLVKGRLVKEMARPKLTLHALTWLSKITSYYPAIVAST